MHAYRLPIDSLIVFDDRLSLIEELTTASDTSHCTLTEVPNGRGDGLVSLTHKNGTVIKGEIPHVNFNNNYYDYASLTLRFPTPYQFRSRLVHSRY